MKLDIICAYKYQIRYHLYHVVRSAYKYEIRYHRQIKGLLPNLQIQTARANSCEDVLTSLNTNVDTVFTKHDSFSAKFVDSDSSRQFLCIDVYLHVQMHI